MKHSGPKSQHSLNRFAWQLACLVGSLATSSPAATTGDDNVQGTAAGDLIYLDLGNDQGDGLGGNDFIFGDPGSDTLIGGEGDDHLIGGSFLPRTDTHGNFFRGGTGNDQLFGGASGDDYFYDSGDGLDIIREFGKGATGTDRLFFGTGIGVAGITYARERGDLILELGGADIVRIESWFGAADHTFRIDELHFTGGESIAGDTLSFEGTSWLGTSNGDTYTAPNATAYWIQGMAGNDTLTGAGGADVLLGGPGTDTLSGGDSGDGLYGDEDADTLHGGNGNDDLYGAEANDTLNGNNGDDLMVGGPGNDTLYGGNGNDTYRWDPGDGDDQLIDSFPEYTAENRLTFPAGVLPAQVELVPASPALKFVVKDGAGQPLGSANIASWYSVVTGNIRHHSTWRVAFADGTLWDGRYLPTPGSDVFWGTTAADVLSGGAGNDSLYGETGDDQLLGGDGDDTLYGWQGNDLLQGGAGNDTLYGEPGNDILAGEAGNDLLYGAAGLDVYQWNLGDGDDSAYDTDTAAGSVSRLEFGAGIAPADIVMEPVPASNDLKLTVMSAGVPAGSMRISSWYQTIGGVRYHTTWRIAFANGVVWDGRYLGTPGNDVLAGTTGADTLSGAAGNDSLYGDSGDDQLSGDDGDDMLAGWNGNDTLQGGSGIDTLYGEAANDILVGGTGNDTLYGGAGLDIYRWSLGDGHDLAGDSDTAAGLENRLEFGAGIAPSDIVIEPIPSSTDLKFTVMSAGQSVGSVRIQSWFNVVGGVRHHTLWRIAFANGVVWDGRYLGTPGNDVLAGTPGADSLSGAAGNDSLYGDSGDDQLFGNDGDDTLYAWQGNDLLQGGAGIDTLNGEAGNDTLVGDAGNDTLNGGAGLDIYRLNLGDGDDFAFDSDTAAGSESRLEFGAGIAPSDIVLEPVPAPSTDLKLTVMSGGLPVGSVRIASWYAVFNSVRHHTTWRIAFANGTVWDGRYVATPGNDTLAGTTGADTLSGSGGNDTLYGDAGNDQLSGDDGNDTLYGYNGNDTLQGGAGNDTLYGEANDDQVLGGEGDDVLSGGLGIDILKGDAGNDTLYGEAGNDVYRWSLGDGHDTAIDSDTAAGSESRVEFGAGVLPSDIVIETITGSSDLKFTVMSGGQAAGSMRIASWFVVTNGVRHHTTWRIAFANGTVWDGRYLTTPGNDVLVGTSGADTFLGGTGNDTINGNDGDDVIQGDAGMDVLDGGNGADTLTGGAGFDQLYGGNGNDTYRWSVGDGDDQITDTIVASSVGAINRLEFGPGILPSQVTLEASGFSLFLIVRDSIGQPQGSVTILYWYAPVSGSICHREAWKIVFADGTEWDGRTLPTPGDDNFTGGSSADTFSGGTGNDTANGAAGNDTLSGGTGIDTLNGGDGDDTLGGDDGNDLLYGGTGNDDLAGGLGNDQLYGEDGNDTLWGGLGNDFLYGGNGSDTYEWSPGDGDDVLSDSYTDTVGHNILAFGSAIPLGKLDFDRLSSYALIVAVPATDGFPAASLKIENWTSTQGSVLHLTNWSLDLPGEGQFRFANPATVGNDVATGTGNADLMLGLAGADTLAGGAGSDLLHGGAGNDSLQGDLGNDHLVGGLGDDLLAGGEGSDRYIIEAGHGVDEIIESSTAAPEEADEIVLGAGILPNSVSVTRDGNDLLIDFGNSAGSLKIRDWFASATRDAAVAWIRFHDGGAWNSEFTESRVGAGPGSGTGPTAVPPLDVETVTTALDAQTPAAASGLEVHTPLQ